MFGENNQNQEEEKNKLYVGNLEWSITEDELRQVFEEKGISVTNIRIVKDKYSGRSKGFGFAELASEDLIQKAIEDLDGQEVKGRKLKISQARKPKDRSERNRDRFPRFRRQRSV